MAEVCGAEHPEHPGVTCIKPQARCFIVHQARQGPKTFEWENPRPRPAPEPNRRKAQDIKDGIKKKAEDDAAAALAAADGGGYQPPIVGNDDPENSHVAATQIEPTRGSKRAAVLDYLRARRGHWVDAPDLATAAVGGFGGTRRMRELRQMGWDIETRQKPGEPNTWQHRLAPVSQLAEDSGSNPEVARHVGSSPTGGTLSETIAS